MTEKNCMLSGSARRDDYWTNTNSLGFARDRLYRRYLESHVHVLLHLRDIRKSVISQNEWVNNIPSPLTGEGQGGGYSTGNRITILGKALRKRPTDAEQQLWNYLRMKQMEGLKFRRQQPIDKYIVDFVCFENRVIIEVDGGQHAAEKNKDIEREKYLQRYGFKVLRFWNNEVLQNTNEVLALIRESCLSHPPLNPLPSREGKEKV